jgi:hypothetical protein
MRADPSPTERRGHRPAVPTRHCGEHAARATCWYFRVAEKEKLRLIWPDSTNTRSYY